MSHDAILEAFVEAMSDRSLDLYSAQEEAILELLDGKHVILNTPTGSGKTLVALAMQFKALCEGRKCVYTSPVKALVSEKFFALCRDFGAENVGMMTGDASVNRDAPIICCTAEILSNLALREGSNCVFNDIIMDEFHYYADRDRGMAWEIPLLTLPQSTFLLMSATLGDTAHIETHLEDWTGRSVARITSTQRPVPLDFSYHQIPVHETIEELLATGRSPIYIVNFTQKDAAQMAQSLTSINVLQKEEKANLKKDLMGTAFDSPYGRDIRRYVEHGIGLHHAGLLPKYRLCVEQLAQKGHLKIICGTDTLGVGVNIPIRSVLFTKLCKFDGQKTTLLSVRDFKQISGRAGRKGFDDAGSVVCQAPEHVVENVRAEARHAAADGKRKRKVVKKKPPEKGYVHWDNSTFNRMQEREPEPLESRFDVNHAIVLNLLQGMEHGYSELMRIIARSHASEKDQKRLRRRSAVLFRSLRDSEILDIKPYEGRAGAEVLVNPNLQLEFSLNQTLSLYLVEALKELDAEDEEYGLFVLTLVESILENPRAILLKQLDKAKRIKVMELKAAGVEYERRMEELEKIEYPKPHRDFIYDTFNAFAAQHPWVGSENIRPKSIAREMIETYSGFTDYIKEYGLERSEGLLLRHLCQVYRALMQTVPSSYYNDAILDMIAFLRTQIARIDSSLIEEWESLAHPNEKADESREVVPPERIWMQNEKAVHAQIRANLHALVSALAMQEYDEALSWLSDGPVEWSPQHFETSLGAYYAEYEKIISDHRARFPGRTRIEKLDDWRYNVRHVLVDPEENCDWALLGEVNLKNWEQEKPLFQLLEIRI